MTLKSIAELAGGALDAACAHIQDHLGVESGDAAGIFFSGEEGEQILRQLVAYINFELSLKEQEA
jgi:hypothetical protein